MKIKIVVTIPKENANDLRAAIGGIGGGQVGEYSYCSFTVSGSGRFIPSESSNPTIGSPGVLEVVNEERIEVTCDRQLAKVVVEKIKSAHPYETPAIDIYELIPEGEL